MREALGLDCGRASSKEEVVVCGRRERNPYRVPFDLEPAPGTRVAGEVMNPRKVMEFNPKHCPAPRPRPKQEAIDILAVAATVATIAANVADPERDKPKPRPTKSC